MRSRAHNIENMQLQQQSQQQQQKPKTKQSQRHKKYVKNILLLSSTSLLLLLLLLQSLGTSEAGVIKKRETHNDPDIVSSSPSPNPSNSKSTTTTTTEAARAPLKLSALESESPKFTNAITNSTKEEHAEKVADKSKESIGKLVLTRVESNLLATTTVAATNTKLQQSINDELDEFEATTTIITANDKTDSTSTTVEPILHAVEQIATVNQTHAEDAGKSDSEHDNGLPAATTARSGDYARAMSTNEESTRSAMMLHALVMSSITEQTQENQALSAEITNKENDIGVGVGVGVEDRTQVEPTLGAPVTTTTALPASATTKTEGVNGHDKPTFTTTTSSTTTSTSADIAKSSHENAIVDESHESKELLEPSMHQEKQPKFISDNSTNAQHMNLPNGVEVWTLASMKLVPESNSDLIARIATTTPSTEMGNEIEQLQRQPSLETLKITIKDTPHDETESHTEFLPNLTLDATESQNGKAATQLGVVNIEEMSTTTEQSIETTSTERSIALIDKNKASSNVDLMADKRDSIAVILATTTTTTTATPIIATEQIQNNDQRDSQTTTTTLTAAAEQNQLENEQRTEPNSNQQKTAVPESTSTSTSTLAPTLSATETATAEPNAFNVHAANDDRTDDAVTHTTANTNADIESKKSAKTDVDSNDDNESVAVKQVRQNVGSKAEHKVDNDANADAGSNASEKTLVAVDDEQISSTAVSQRTAGEESTTSIRPVAIDELLSVGERGITTATNTTTTTIRTLPIIEIITTTTTTETSQISNEVNLEAGEKINLKINNNKNDAEKATETLKNDEDDTNKPTNKPTETRTSSLTNNTTAVEPNELIISAAVATTTTTAAASAFEKSNTTSDVEEEAATTTSVTTLANGDVKTNGSTTKQVAEIEITTTATTTTTTTTTTKAPVVKTITDVKVSEPKQQQEEVEKTHDVKEKLHESSLDSNNIGETVEQQQQQVVPITTTTTSNIGKEELITIRVTPTSTSTPNEIPAETKPNKLHETRPNTLPEVDDNSAYNKEDYDDDDEQGEDMLQQKITATTTTETTTTTTTTTKPVDSMATLKATELQQQQNLTTTTNVPIISLLDDTTTTTTTTTTTPKSIVTQIGDIYKVITTTTTARTTEPSNSVESDTMLPQLNIFETTTSATANKQQEAATITATAAIATTSASETNTLQLGGFGINSIDPTMNYNPQIPMDMDNLQTKTTDSGGGTDVNVIIAITVSVIGVVALILLVAFLYLMRKRQKQTSYGQRCRPVSLDAYSLDNVSVLGSVRRKSALRASKRSYGNAAFDDPALRHNVLNANELAKFVERKSSIYEEFRDVPQIIARADEVPAGCEDKNRYANVIPLPETRVVLQQLNGDDKTEYINANYVRGPKDAPNYYIACQAPLETTVADFWRMIWEQQSRVIIQATDLNENGIEKCAEYLPPSVTLDNHTTYGDFQVTLKNREIKDKYAISTILLKHIVDNASRELTHYWYKWPEAGVPNEEAPIIAMLLEARSSLKSYAIEQANELKEKSSTLTLKSVESGDGNESNGSSATQNAEKQAASNGTEINGNIATDRLKAAARNQGPLTIHCSPGTGRTGTIIACDMAIRNLETPKRSVDIPQIVYYVRRGRASAVQTKEQYEFIYKVANMYATKITNLSSEA